MTESKSAGKRLAGHGRLITTLGVGFGIAVAIGNTIGAGIVRAPGVIANLLPSTWLYFAAWAVGGLYMSLGALQFAELGALLPKSGGQYNFSRAALGDYAGFIVGWSDWISTAGSFAAVSIVFAEYAGDLLPFAHGRVRPIAAGVILLFALLQWKSMKIGSGVQNFTTILKAVLFLAVVAVCFFHQATPVTALASRAAVPVGWPLFVSFIVALQAVIYTYDGWYGVVYFGGEVHNPGREIPRAIFGTVISVLAIYFLVNAAIVHLVSVREFAGSDFAMGIAARRVLGAAGDNFIRVVVVVGLLSSVNAMEMATSRALYAMSRDGLFFPLFARVNSGGIPAPSLWLSTAVGLCFAMFSFERVAAILASFFVADYALTFVSLFVLRKRMPDAERPHRAWGYPWTTSIALIASVVFLIGALASDRENTPLTFLVLAASYPVYRALKWAARRSAERTTLT
ncbi:MAG TPA: APC family permease [Candidatus Acidoferrales bacterium]|nr:APC family permease [Candidatus Acidoferrales bacterium]